MILVGEMRDRETIEIALTAAETGHLVFSTLHTIDASKTVERIIGSFEAADQQSVRTRLASSFRYIMSQRLVPNKTGGRVAVLEILKSTMRTREYLERGENEGKSLLDAMRDGELDGMQYFDGELEKLLRAGVITRTDAISTRPTPATCRCCSPTSRQTRTRTRPRPDRPVSHTDTAARALRPWQRPSPRAI